MDKKPKYLSLFTGIGGLDYGLEASGFQSIGCIESDDDAVQSLLQNTNWKIYHQDISKFNFSTILKDTNLKVKELDLLVGGPPCQSYSKSSFWATSVKRGYSDKRGKLIDHYMRAVEELLPKVFLIENVPGFIFSDQNSGMSSVLKSISRIQRKHGIKYNLSCKVINCADYGVPQRRERFFLIATRSDSSFTFPLPTHGLPNSIEVKKGFLRPYNTSAKAFAGIDYKKIKENVDVGGKWKELLPCIPPGQNYQFFTPKGDGKSLFKYRSRFWTFLLKLAPHEPSWTIQASPGSSTGPFHWENRKLFSRELARLQTLPDHVKLGSNSRSNHKLIGNAVPSLIGEILGKEILRQIFSKKVSRNLKLIPEQNAPKVRISYKTRLPAAFH